MLLADWQIVEPMVLPCSNLLKQEGVISFGKSSMGYDIRLGTRFLSPNIHDGALDPKNAENEFYEDRRVRNGRISLLPGTFILGETLEKFSIPNNVLALCVGKSTYARCGIIVNVTPLEPGWKGVLTLEIHNASQRPVYLYCNEGIAQVLFFRGAACDTSYADRKGKYQDQTGVTPARMFGGTCEGT